MGEAGLEAIMPLKRGEDGSLGVRALDSSTNFANPEIHIHQTINVSGNEDKALNDAMQQAALAGAKQVLVIQLPLSSGVFRLMDEHEDYWEDSGGYN
ncbi:phage tail tape measure protein [Arsenophonus endosymbiont of Aleurodicus floccissimus]|uniref:phage tail tape measure protein n=1 Tax=Arsenophonus endosymbiont of Aleurodicus floccissimus TaxID=2152761 RepID=UPI0016007313